MGCSFMVFNQPSKMDMNTMLEFFTKLNADKDDERWEQFSSFFMTVKSDMDVSFGDGHAGEIDLGILKGLVGDIPDDVK